MVPKLHWISGEEFAEMGGHPERTARYYLSQAALGKPSRKYSTIIVRRSHGRGGRSGLRYEVLLASLPIQFQPSISALLEAPKKPLQPAAYRPTCEGQFDRQMARYRIIERALRYPAGSRERADELRDASDRSSNSIRTLQRWIAQFEAHGIEGLARKKPSDAGRSRIIVSEKFDQAFLAAGYDAAILPELSDHADLMIRSLWATRAADAGAPDLGKLAEHLLLEECERRGLDLPRSAFSLGKHRVLKWRPFEKINMMKTDAKRFKDELPRITRDWTGYAPMEIVVIDVKHLDVIVKRADGSTAWPKMVGFMDAGTGRIFPHFVLCEQRRSIR